MFPENKIDPYIHRDEEYEQIVAALLDSASIKLAAITTALTGAGGFGKTTLAKAVCRDKRIQQAYPDGILWATLGEHPTNIIGLLEDWIISLIKEKPGFTDIVSASAHLRKLLFDRQMLIVIDDVWNQTHLEPFLQGGSKCAYLMTTRNNGTIPIGATKVFVDAMSSKEAAELLQVGLPTINSYGLNQLAERLRRWPLLLNLANSMLRQTVYNNYASTDKAIEYVNQLYSSFGLTAFDLDNPLERSQAAAKSLTASISLVKEEDQVKFEDLAIFPEDANIPLDAIQTLWGYKYGMDNVSARRLCVYLHNHSLLLQFDMSTGYIRLHDVIRDFLISKIGKELHNLNLDLISAYKEKCNGGWDTGPNDGYFFKYLPYHLLKDDRQAEVYWLLLNPEWIFSKLHSNCTRWELLSDYDLLEDYQGLDVVKRSLNMMKRALIFTPSITELSLKGLKDLLSFYYRLQIDPNYRYFAAEDLE